MGPDASDVIFSEYVEGGYYTKAVELFNPTNVDLKLDGIALQWHHGSQRFTPTANKGYDMKLNGFVIKAGKTFVICRDQNPSKALDSGKCDITNKHASLKGQSVNAMKHTGDDAIEMLYHGKVIDIIGKVRRWIAGRTRPAGASPR